MRALLLYLLSLSAHAYLQFILIRHPHHTTTIPLLHNPCPAPPTNAEHQELCFEKDVAYAIPLFNNGQQLLAVDLTVPISWLKRKDCVVLGTNLPCSRALQTKNPGFRMFLPLPPYKLQREGGILIEGSNEVVFGEQELQSNFIFKAYNIDRFHSFLDILRIGLFLDNSESDIGITQTTFIHATHITDNVNRLMDGALSLRMNSPHDSSIINTFLQEICSITQSKTVMISGNRLVFGGVPKEHRGKNIKKILLRKDEKYGLLPQVSKVVLTSILESPISIQASVPAVLTLSATYLAFPNTILERILIELRPFGCLIDLRNQLSCSAITQDFLSFTLSFQFITAELSFTFQELLLHRDAQEATFKLKQTGTNYIIIGEPLFLKYNVLFDQTHSTVGLSLNDPSDNNVLALIAITRLLFLLLITSLLCIFSEGIGKCPYEIFKKFALVEKQSGNEKNIIIEQ